MLQALHTPAPSGAGAWQASRCMHAPAFYPTIIDLEAMYEETLTPSHSIESKQRFPFPLLSYIILFYSQRKERYVLTYVSFPREPERQHFSVWLSKSWMALLFFLPLSVIFTWSPGSWSPLNFLSKIRNHMSLRVITLIYLRIKMEPKIQWSFI